MSDADAFYGVFWILPSVPLPRIGEIIIDGDPFPEPARLKRAGLQEVLASLDLSNPESIRDAIGYCDQYIRSLRAARTVWDGDGHCVWTSAIHDETVTIAIAFEEPMALLLQATLLLNLGTSIASARTPECISGAAKAFCQAAGLVDFVLVSVDDVSSEYQIDVPLEMPELAPRVLHALFDMALHLAQQLALVKATLHFDAPYSQSVLQKLHVSCQLCYEAFETAVVKSCYQSRPKRDSCTTTLLGFATLFSRLHRALALQVEGEVESTEGRIGEAIAYFRAACRQLHERQSMRDIGLPPLSPTSEPELVELVQGKRAALQTVEQAWTKDNESIYFASTPSEESILAVELPHAVIMKAERYTSSTRLGSARMFREPSVDGGHQPEDIVMAIHGGIEELKNHGGDGDGQAQGGGGGRRASAERADMTKERYELMKEDEDGAGSGDSNSHSDSAADSEAAEHHHDKEDQERLAATAGTPTTVATETSTVQQLPRLAGREPLHASNKALSVSAVSHHPFLGGSRSTRRMATRVQPTKAATQRRLIGSIGHQDSLVTLNLGAEQLQRHVTEESLLKMKNELATGKEVYRLSKEKWKKETLRVQEDQLVLVRKKGFGLLTLSKQLKIPWSTVHALQHELMPVNQVLQLLAPRGKRMTSILVIAGKGDQVGPTEFALASPEQNACAVAYLQSLLQEKKKVLVVQPGAAISAQPSMRDIHKHK